MHPGSFIGQKALRNVIFYRAVKGAKYDEKITRMVARSRFGAATVTACIPQALAMLSVILRKRYPDSRKRIL